MENWQKSIDQQIEEAQRSGKFDNLPGKGKPLKLNENPFQDPALDAAYTLLKDNDFTLPWIAEGFWPLLMSLLSDCGRSVSLPRPQLG